MPSPLKARTQPDVPRRSLIKPQLLNLSTSGTLLEGVIVERNRERARVDIDSAAVKASQHLLVVHAGAAARLEWRDGSTRKDAMFASGEAIINPMGLFIAPRWDAPVELLLIALNPALVSRVAEELGRHAPLELVPRVHLDDALMRQLAISLISEWERDVPPDRVYAESLAHTLVAHVVRHHSVAGVRHTIRTGGLPPRSLARVIDYVNDTLSEPVTLDAMARVAGISTSHLAATFKRSTGQAPHQFVMAQRLDRARALLIGTRLPIAEVARRTGFADQSHLTRLLRRQTGLTPRLLRGSPRRDTSG